LFYRFYLNFKHLGPPGLPGFSGGGMMTGTVTYQNTETMMRMSANNPVGTLAFILDEEALLVRVVKGWQYLAVRKYRPFRSTFYNFILF
jgi:Collagen trimerization domain